MKTEINKGKKIAWLQKKECGLYFPDSLEKEIPTQARHRAVRDRQNDFSDGKSKIKQTALGLKLHKFPRSNCQPVC